MYHNGRQMVSLKILRENDRVRTESEVRVTFYNKKYLYHDYRVILSPWSLQTSRKYPHLTMYDMVVLGVPLERYGLLDI